MPACWPARIALPWGPWPSPATPAAAGRVSRICKISCRMHSFTGPQPLLTCEWRDAYLETSVGYDMHRTLGTSNDASYIRLMPLTGSKNRFRHQMAVKMERVNGNTAGVIPQFGLGVAYIHQTFRLSTLGGQKNAVSRSARPTRWWWWQ